MKPYCFRNCLMSFRLVVLAGHWIMQLRFFPPLRGEQHLNSSSLSLSYQSNCFPVSVKAPYACLFSEHRALALSCPTVVMVCGHTQLREGLEDDNTLSPDVFVPFSVQAVKQLLELPLNLAVVSPAHTPNWDLVSDVVNSCSRVYRSPKQCRNRYENVIIPREEGKVSSRGMMHIFFTLSCRVFFPYLHKHLFFVKRFNSVNK